MITAYVGEGYAGVERNDIYGSGCIITCDNKIVAELSSGGKEKGFIYYKIGTQNAVIMAVQYALDNGIDEIHICYGDTNIGIEKYITGEWKAPVQEFSKKYVDFIRSAERKSLKITFEDFYAHFYGLEVENGTDYIKLANKLAEKAIKQFKESERN